MDAFFASVEERDKPYLKGLPVIVGADPQAGRGRGVVATANYTARELGIGSALPIRAAWELCEAYRKIGGVRCVFITSGFHRYASASREVFAIVREYVPVVMQTSVDEAYLDLGFCKTFARAEVLAKKLRKEIKKRTKLTSSIGISNSRMVAKIASDYGKPNGLTVVLPRHVETFLRPLHIRNIPGIGVRGGHIFARLGVKTIGDAQKYSWEEMQKQFGKHGFLIWERVRGIDKREMETRKVTRKSIGKHHTFGEDTRDMKKAVETIQQHIKVILKEVTAQGFKEFRTVVLTVRFDDFVTVTRSLTLDEPISSARQLELKVIKLLLPFFERTENPKNKALRLIGVRVEKLT
jgi:nucleotidyltransferase/DNA polymerase involved in DNA repair